MTTNGNSVVDNHVNGLSSNSIVGDYGDSISITEKVSSIAQHTTREEEMIRLIGQYLCDKGFKTAYQHLSKESGIALEHKASTELRHAILEGRWDDAESSLDQLALAISNTSSLAEVRFLLLEQRFLEHLEANEVMSAVTLLRNRITPMQRNTDRVHTLASVARQEGLTKTKEVTLSSVKTATVQEQDH